MNQDPQITPEILEKSTPIYKSEGKDSHGGQVWQQGLLVRKVNKFDANTPDDFVFTVPVAYDPKNDKILADTVPPQLRDELLDKLCYEEAPTGIIKSLDSEPENETTWGTSQNESTVEDSSISEDSWGTTEDDFSNQNSNNNLNIQWD